MDGRDRIIPKPLFDICFAPARVKKPIRVMGHDCLYIMAHHVGAVHVKKRPDIGGHFHRLFPARQKGEGIGNPFQVLPYLPSVVGQ